MKLFKHNLTKEITSPKVVERLIREGWSTDEIDEPVITQPKQRGRPAKKDNKNG